MPNGKVTLAVLRNDVEHIRVEQSEMRSDIKEIKNILTDGTGKIAETRESIKMMKWVFGGIATIIMIVTLVIASLK